jgi:hypothetical protein
VLEIVHELINITVLFLFELSIPITCYPMALVALFSFLPVRTLCHSPLVSVGSDIELEAVP